MTISRKELLDLLNRDDVRGKVVRDAADLEDSLGIALTFYFSTKFHYIKGKPIKYPNYTP